MEGTRFTGHSSVFLGPGDEGLEAKPTIQPARKMVPAQSDTILNCFIFHVHIKLYPTVKLLLFGTISPTLNPPGR